MNLGTNTSKNTSPACWTSNGFRYWRLETADAEVVASIGDTYTPFVPPMHAKYELYTRVKGEMRFQGYLAGEQLARIHHCFREAFSDGRVMTWASP